MSENRYGPADIGPYLSRMMIKSATSPQKYIFSITLPSSKTPCARCRLLRRYMTTNNAIFRTSHSSGCTLFWSVCSVCMSSSLCLHSKLWMKGDETLSNVKRNVQAWLSQSMLRRLSLAWWIAQKSIYLNRFDWMWKGNFDFEDMRRPTN